MSIEIREEPVAALADHARVSIAFEVRERLALRVPDAGLGGLLLELEAVPEPYVKDYDRERGNHPAEWPRRFDVAGWGMLSAWLDGARVGGAVLAWESPALDVMEGDPELAVLWDLRVSPDHRGRGVGSALFAAAERWALARGALRLKVETQNINVAACRFYASRGCELGAMHRFAYPTLPDEVQLLWYKSLGPHVPPVR